VQCVGPAPKAPDPPHSQITSQFNVPTSLTPALRHLLRFHFVGCANGELINRPVVSLLDTRVSGTSAEVIPERINMKLPAAASREWELRQVRYISTDTRGKKCLTETSRPGLISVMRPDLPQPTHGLEPKYVSGDILLLRL
jgi:hypothetical protein